MAGHNKWSKVKRIKAVVDARKGKVFCRISRDITLAAKSGGGDPEGNARLRTLLLKAREANMPADNVDRAIKKGTGELPGVTFEDITYEGYGPGGVAFVIKVTTDNKNRAAADVRSYFNEFGGNLAGSGAVAFQFTYAGQILVSRETVEEERLMELALEAGADDILSTEEGYDIRTPVTQFDRVLAALEKAGLRTESAELAYIPNNTVTVSEVHVATALFELQEALEGSDDVQQVFSNEEIAEAVAEAARAGLN